MPFILPLLKKMNQKISVFVYISFFFKIQHIPSKPMLYEIKFSYLLIVSTYPFKSLSFIIWAHCSECSKAMYSFHRRRQEAVKHRESRRDSHMTNSALLFISCETSHDNQELQNMHIHISLLTTSVFWSGNRIFKYIQETGSLVTCGAVSARLLLIGIRDSAE